ncbi:hypothetical protein [Effusibacillus pohliae]|uniref:hypothetical protein n=1 Tax=Effusibacillus pohliae TaxID=232270 RepID=UPI00036F420F|nr:hypothetical protein [Effusibacillus pohliae]
MQNQHVLFQTLHMVKNDTEYHFGTLDKLLKKLERRLERLEKEVKQLPNLE